MSFEANLPLLLGRDGQPVEEAAPTIPHSPPPNSHHEDDIAIRVRRLSKCYQIYDRPEDRLKQSIVPRLQRLMDKPPRNYFREFWALKDVSFDVRKGETVGIVGRNGSGKSTLLQIICGTLAPTSGVVETSGRVAALLELGSGFNPEFTGRENVYMNGAVLGLSKEEIDARFDEIAAFADIGQFIEQPVKTYSSGMVVRLAFSVVANLRPEVLVVDEALAVGDAAFQRKCVRRIEDLVETGVVLLFVSHDLETVKKICSKAIYLNGGEVALSGTAKEVCIAYERDLFGSTQQKENITSAHTKSTDEATGVFDPELANGCEKVYGSGGGEILDIDIKTLDGKRVNLIPTGTTFLVSYRVKFLDAVAEPVFGMMIADRQGVCVFGTNTSGMSASARGYRAGDEVRVEFQLQNNLGPGIYYLTCGVHAPGGGDGVVYIQRRIDAVIFKSMGPEGIRVSGYSYLFPIVRAISA